MKIKFIISLDSWKSWQFPYDWQDLVDEITIIYQNLDSTIWGKRKIWNIDNKRIFGEKFVENNKNICKIIVNGEKYYLCSNFDKFTENLNEKNK